MVQDCVYQLTNLNMSDIDMNEGEVRVLGKKGRAKSTVRKKSNRWLQIGFRCESSMHLRIKLSLSQPKAVSVYLCEVYKTV